MRANETKQKIKESFIVACEQVGYRQVSIQQVAQLAAINRQTFYYHFKDKQSVLRFVYDQDALIYLHEEGLHIDNWEERALKMLQVLKKHATFYTTIIEEARELFIADVFTLVYNHFARLFHQVDVEKELSEKDIEFYSRFFSYGCCGILENWIQTGYEETPLEIAGQLFQLAKDVEFFCFRLYQQMKE